MQKYKTLTRTSLSELGNVPFCGVYVVAYMGKIVYVGKASQDVVSRLIGHWQNRMNEPLGNWMDKVRADWDNVALDVLEPPDNVNVDYWLQSAESALVQRLNPLFNTALVL